MGSGINLNCGLRPKALPLTTTSVMFVTFFDTTMVGLTSLIVWRLRPWMVVLPWLAIACMDGAFLSSALTKFTHGAWYVIEILMAIAALIATIVSVTP